MTGLFVIFVKDYQNGRIMEDCNRYIRFDWAAKRMLRDKANFSVLEGLISVLLNQDVKKSLRAKETRNKKTPSSTVSI